MRISMKNRKIGYTYGSVSGHFSFRKQKSIAFESTLERDLLTLLEFNDSVEDVIEQPLTIEYKNNNGRTVTYTPDFLVHFKEPDASLLRLQRKPLLIEVKPTEKLQKHFQELRPRFKIAVQYAHANDMIFKIYDERRIRTQYLKNIMFLKRYKRHEFQKEDENLILTYVHSIGNISIEYVLEALSATKEHRTLILNNIWHMLLHKKLLCHFDKKLNLQTEIWINETIEIGALQ